MNLKRLATAAAVVICISPIFMNSALASIHTDTASVANPIDGVKMTTEVLETADVSASTKDNTVLAAYTASEDATPATDSTEVAAEAESGISNEQLQQMADSMDESANTNNTEAVEAASADNSGEEDTAMVTEDTANAPQATDPNLEAEQLAYSLEAAVPATSDEQASSEQTTANQTANQP